MPLMPDFPTTRNQNDGFTLIELALVTVLIGLIIGVGVAGFYSLLQGQRLAASRSGLSQVKHCLMRRMLFSERYPSFTDALSCSPTTSETVDVDACLCRDEIHDAWNHPYRFIETRQSPGGLSMAGTPVVDDELKSQVRTTPSSNCRVITHTGETLDDVAYVILSYGQDELPGDPSYGNLFTGPGDLAASMDCTAPLDFTNKGDDLYLVVSSRELATYLRR